MSIRNVLAVGLTWALFTSVSFAGNIDSSWTGKGMHHGEGFWKTLNLTADQQVKIKALHDEMNTVREKHRGEIQVVRQKIVDELKKPSPSQSSLDSYARELGDLNVKMTQERSAHPLKVKGVLTPEQFNQMIDHQVAKFDDMMGGKMGPEGGKHACPNAATCPHAKSGCSAGKGAEAASNNK